MKLANVIKIKNNTEKVLMLRPKDSKYDFLSMFIPSKSFYIKDFESCIAINLDEMFFQFVGEKEQIHVNYHAEYDIELEWFI